MKSLFATLAFSAFIMATTMAIRYTSGGYNSGAYAPSVAVPVGYLQAQRVVPAAIRYSGPAAVYAAPAAGYGAPAAGYGAPAAAYGRDTQVESLTRIALSLPTPAPDTSNNGRGYGSKYAAPSASY